MLLEDDLLQEFGADHFADLGSLVSQLLGGLFAAEDLVAKHFAFRSEAVHGSVVFVFNREANVPIFGIVLGLLEEEFVIHDRPILLLGIEKGLGRFAKAGEIRVHLSGLHPDQRDSPDWAFGVVFLGENGGGEQQ